MRLIAKSRPLRFKPKCVCARGKWVCDEVACAPPADVPQAGSPALHNPLARILPAPLAEGALPSLLSTCLGLGSCLVSIRGTGRGGAGGEESTWGWG